MSWSCYTPPSMNPSLPAPAAHLPVPDPHHPLLAFHREVLSVQQWSQLRHDFLTELERAVGSGVVWNEPNKLWRHSQEALGKWLLSQVARIPSPTHTRPRSAEADDEDEDEEEEEERSRGDEWPMGFFGFAAPTVKSSGRRSDTRGKDDDRHRSHRGDASEDDTATPPDPPSHALGGGSTASSAHGHTVTTCPNGRDGGAGINRRGASWQPTSSAARTVSTYDEQLIRDLSLKSNAAHDAAALTVLQGIVQRAQLGTRCAACFDAVQSAMSDVRLDASSAILPQLYCLDDRGSPQSRRNARQRRVCGPIVILHMRWPQSNAHGAAVDRRHCPSVCIPWPAFVKLRRSYAAFGAAADSRRYRAVFDCSPLADPTVHRTSHTPPSAGCRSSMRSSSSPFASSSSSPPVSVAAVEVGQGCERWKEAHFWCRAAAVMLRYEGALATGSLQLCADSSLKAHLHAHGYHVMDLCASPINAYMGVPARGRFDTHHDGTTANRIQPARDAAHDDATRRTSGSDESGAPAAARRACGDDAEEEEMSPNVFCSAFADTDGYFGSLGSALHIDTRTLHRRIAVAMAMAARNSATMTHLDTAERAHSHARHVSRLGTHCGSGHARRGSRLSMEGTNSQAGNEPARGEAAASPLLLTLDVPYDEDLCELLFLKLARDMQHAVHERRAHPPRARTATASEPRNDSTSHVPRIDYVLVLPLWWEVNWHVPRRVFGEGGGASHERLATVLAERTKPLREGHLVPYTWPAVLSSAVVNAASPATDCQATAAAAAALAASTTAPRQQATTTSCAGEQPTQHVTAQAASWACFDGVFLGESYSYFCTATNRSLRGVTATEVVGLTQPSVMVSESLLATALRTFYGSLV